MTRETIDKQKNHAQEKPVVAADRRPQEQHTYVSRDDGVDMTELPPPITPYLEPAAKELCEATDP
ncbi:hypothetical protein AB0E83_33875, partial [Streptomyces sp. NPDC035033]|uniref:hypothetical protein n=1 Tax=Streptomyces sp. NPDC035033 TaxID=3155368 RepID=UPI0033F8EAD2